jgi:16S rRNA (cytosine1402-N4)-methyltransferase
MNKSNHYVIILSLISGVLPALSFSMITNLQQQNHHKSLCPLLLALKDDIEDSTVQTPRLRRKRYSGRYPRNFEEKYKEHQGDESTIQKVLAKGMTPAGMHVPIMVKECLHFMGLDTLTANEDDGDLLVIDCTLGHGGHSSFILKYLCDRNDGSRLISFDQDSIEIKKTQERLITALKENNLPSLHETGQTCIKPYIYHDQIFNTVNQNFQTLASYLSSSNQMGKVTNLLADLGLSSMQIDDNSRGFTYKRDGPLDMRMNPDDENIESAYDLLRHLRVRQLKSLLRENSDEVFASEIAVALVGKGSKVPETTVELAERVRDTVRPLLQKKGGKMTKKETAETKKQLDSTIARVMQAIRIEVNGEFRALDKLLADIPNILAPGGRAVFLTFHSGEDRRVKKSFKNGFKSGIYSAWSDDVVRPTKEERRNNPRSSCCKLRWAVRSEKKLEEELISLD